MHICYIQRELIARTFEFYPNHSSLSLPLFSPPFVYPFTSPKIALVVRRKENFSRATYSSIDLFSKQFSSVDVDIFFFVCHDLFPESAVNESALSVEKKKKIKFTKQSYRLNGINVSRVKSFCFEIYSDKKLFPGKRTPQTIDFRLACNIRSCHLLRFSKRIEIEIVYRI